MNPRTSKWQHRDTLREASPTPDNAHDRNMKLAQQERNAHDGIYVTISDPDLGFWFEDLHPDRQPPCASGDDDAQTPENR